MQNVTAFGTTTTDLELINVPFSSGYVCEVTGYVLEDQPPVMGTNGYFVVSTAASRPDLKSDHFFIERIQERLTDRGVKLTNIGRPRNVTRIEPFHMTGHPDIPFKVSSFFYRPTRLQNLTAGQHGFQPDCYKFCLIRSFLCLTRGSIKSAAEPTLLNNLKGNVYYINTIKI